MKLHFLGQTYTASNRSIETEFSSQQGRFLGQSYNFSRPMKVNKAQLSLRKYRGITYQA